MNRVEKHEIDKKATPQTTVNCNKGKQSDK